MMRLCKSFFKRQNSLVIKVLSLLICWKHQAVNLGNALNKMTCYVKQSETFMVSLINTSQHFSSASSHEQLLCNRVLPLFSEGRDLKCSLNGEGGSKKV